jgi:hypothetical protein
MARFNGGVGGTGRKHHKKKRGVTTKSNYPARLAARGLTSRSVHMRPLDDLRKRAARRAAGEQEDEE